ncbi:GHKL domain-containing protein [Candidatus Desantisbacteria bacterium]|nr:GHKL domain-containing protein [Candidatus Desantisbacteria bacterium]
MSSISPQILRKRKRHVSIVISFILSILLLFNLWGWSFYPQAKHFLDEELGKRLISIAVSTAMQVSPELITLIKGGTIDDAQLFNLREDLTIINEENNLESIFIIDKENNYILDAESEHLEGERYRCLNIEDTTKFLDASLGKSFCSKLYNNNKGKQMFKTGFAPLKDASGEVIAILGVDASPKFLRVLTQFKNALIVFTIISLVLGFFSILILLAVIKGFISTQEAIFHAEKLASLGRLSAGMAHDIRNPLQIIHTTYESLRKRHLPQDIEDEMFDYIPDEIKNLNKKINSFLSQTKDAPLEIELNNLKALLDHIIDRMSPDMERATVRINKHIEPEINEFYFDRQQMEGIFQNLIRNAIEAMPDGGAITIKAYHYKGGKQFVAIDVSGTGSGIHPRDQKKLFEPFFTTKEHGYGLGMSIVFRIIQKHGGEIKVKSKPNQGTTFTILLPWKM